MEDKDKSIDESWKETAKKEKEELKHQEGKEEFAAPEPTYSFFITTLALQASISLGIIPNPADNKTETNLPQAKFLIDTITMVQEKTKNNLTKEETDLTANILYELRMNFVNKNKAGGAQ
jgi:hypothetical protein